MSIKRARSDFIDAQDSIAGLVNGDKIWTSLSNKLGDIASLLANLADETTPKPKKTFVVAVCGHFSSGKSSFLNAVIGTDLCPVDTEITTKANTRFEYGEQPAIYQLGNRRREISREEYQEIVQGQVKPDEEVRFKVCLNNPILKRFVFLDTPGRGADDAVVGDGDSEDYYRDARPSSDDAASDAACEEADCIVYLSQPKNMHEEDELFLRSGIAQAKPVLVVMPKIDRLKDDGPQLIKAYQANIERIRKDNKSISVLYCCGGFGRKKPNQALKEESLQKIFAGLDDLYRDAGVLWEKGNRERQRRRAASLNRVNDLMYDLEKTALPLHLSQQDVDEFERNLARYYSEEDGYCQWLNMLVKDANDMLTHFRDRASQYCCREEYDLTTNHARVRSTAIRKVAEERVKGMVEVLRSRIRVILDTILGCKDEYGMAEAEVNKLGDKVSGFVGDAVGWWDKGNNTWPGDVWYWFNSDVDRVGREAVLSWVNDRLLKHCQLITQDVDAKACADRIEGIITKALAKYRKLRADRLKWLSRLDGIIADFKKRK